MIPVVSQLVGLVVAFVVGIACAHGIRVNGPRLDLLLLGALSLAAVAFVSYRAWRFAREVRDAVDLGDH